MATAYSCRDAGRYGCCPVWGRELDSMIPLPVRVTLWLQDNSGAKMTDVSAFTHSRFPFTALQPTDNCHAPQPTQPRDCPLSPPNPPAAPQVPSEGSSRWRPAASEPLSHSRCKQSCGSNKRLNFGAERKPRPLEEVPAYGCRNFCLI